MLKQLRPALVSVLAFTVLTGFLFPAVIWALGNAVFPRQALGSLIESDGKVIGSEIIGQNFAHPEYFHPRPSAAGSGYDAAASSGTNLGPTSRKLIEGAADDAATKDTDESYAGVKQLVAAYRAENGLPANMPVPADAVTRSASGLDPHISAENAALQAGRVARARGITEGDVRRLVAAHTEGRTFGILGERRVNVVLLNRDLDNAAERQR
ncbi:MAG: K(+)-transporting ATPase subunit C [Armatimonadota bacterium]